MDIFETYFRQYFSWYRALNYQAMRHLLLEALPKPQQRLVYQLTSPETSSEELESELVKHGYKVPSRTVRSWQADWMRSGLLRGVSERKRERVFDLNEFGIEVGIPDSEAKINPIVEPIKNDDV